MSNFEFFDGTWERAAKVAQKAEQIIYQDPSGALQHLRKYGVMVAKNIIELEGITEPERFTQFDRLLVLDAENILPKDIKDHFHSIRMTGNDAIYQDAGSLSKAIAILESAYFISIWAYRAYSLATFTAKEFEIPQKSSEKRTHFIADNTITDKMAIFEQDSVKTNADRGIVATRTPRTRARGDKRNPGEINIKNQELLVRTNVHSHSKPDQYIWIIECKDCFNVYGANGCDYHIRKCPQCQGGNPGEPQELWNHYMVNPQGENTQKSHGHTERLTLHEAMIIVLSQADKRTMEASELAEKIFDSGLYVKREWE